MDRAAVLHLPEPGALFHLDTVFHDLQRPVAAIGAALAAACHEPTVTPAVEGWLGLAQAEVRRLADLIEHSMCAAFVPRSVDLADLLREVVRDGRTSQRVQLHLPGGPMGVTADPVLLCRGIENLVDNASRAAGPCGQVTVTVTTDGRWARIAVEDDGPGPGLGPAGRDGRGLRTVARVADAHGGRFEVLRAQGGGTLATLMLPSPLADGDAP